VDYAALEKQIDEEQRQYEAGAKSMLMFGMGNPLLMGIYRKYIYNIWESTGNIMKYIYI
jgi:hypothetical protein